MYLEIFTWWVLSYELSPFSKIPDLHTAANLGRHFLLLKFCKFLPLTAAFLDMSSDITLVVTDSLPQRRVFKL
jgi:hypothetical protein